MNREVQPCPHCSAPFDGLACSFCLSRFTRGPAGEPIPVYPDAQVGTPIIHFDYTRDLLPGQDQPDVVEVNGAWRRRTPEGTIVALSVPCAMFFTHDSLGMRDSCVRAEMVALDPGIEIVLALRDSFIEAVQVSYRLYVNPEERTFTVGRCFGSPEGVHMQVLVDKQMHPAIAPVGQINALELRVRAATLHVWLNGVHACAAHDAAIGFGNPSIGVRRVAPSDGYPRRVLARSMAIAEVAP